MIIENQILEGKNLANTINKSFVSVNKSDDDDDKLYLTTLTLSTEAAFHNGRVKKTLTEFYK